MIDTIDILLRQLNKCVENEISITVSADTKNLNMELNILPVEVLYDDNGLDIIDGNGFHFRITEPDRFELVESDEYGDKYYAFRNQKNHEYYGICF